LYFCGGFIFFPPSSQPGDGHAPGAWSCRVPPVYTSEGRGDAAAHRREDEVHGQCGARRHNVRREEGGIRRSRGLCVGAPLPREPNPQRACAGGVLTARWCRGGEHRVDFAARTGRSIPM